MQNKACFMEGASGYRAPDGLTSQGARTGRLDEDQDPVEAAAAKVAEAHAEHAGLGPFDRWRVEAGRRDRLAHQARSEAEAAAFESR